MPTYIMLREDTGEERDFVFTIAERPNYGEIRRIDGIKWKRIMEHSAPNAAIDINVDPFSQRKFLEKTGAGTKGSMGDIWERSAELSEKRAAQTGGQDPIKDKFFKSYSQSRKGAPHPQAVKEKTYTI